MNELFEEVSRVPSTTANSSKRTRIANIILDNFLEFNSPKVKVNPKKLNLSSNLLYSALLSANRQKKFRRSISIHKDGDDIYLARINK